ncbi:MAG: translation elongation factor Ts [Bdellovibrionaceae bacterium]|nr:translation elongation factor Ts [Pseudobdellovibrionaceae bacterium]
MDLIKELREKTGAGMMDCKKALLECSNDVEKAAEYLRKQGIAKAAKRSGRAAAEGLIQSYIHGNGKIGVLLELNCETDFVAKTDDFQKLAHEISLQIAASSPQFLNADAVPADVVEKEKSVLREVALKEGKPAQVIDKILDGQIKKFFQDICLMEQPYVKEPKKNIETLIKEHIGKLGENITVRRFSRFQVGEKLPGQEA